MASIVRSQPLHKFPLSNLKWSISSTRFGGQAVDSTPQYPVPDSGVGQIESESDDRRVWTHCSSLQAARSGAESSTKTTVVIDPAVVEKTAAPSVESKLLIRIRSKEKSSVVAEEAEKQPPPQAQARAVAASDQEESTSRVWNLRPRKPSYKKSVANSAIGGSFGVPHDDSAATLRKCTDVNGEVKEEEKKKKKKKLVMFSVALSKEEIEADFLLLAGAKPPRRPKKRPRAVQKQVDCIFPGLSLPFAVAPQMYDVSLPAP